MSDMRLPYPFTADEYISIDSAQQTSENFDLDSLINDALNKSSEVDFGIDQ